MIGYCHIPGLGIEATSTIALDRHGCIIEFAESREVVPSTEVSLLALNVPETLRAIEDDFCPMPIAGIAERELRRAAGEQFVTLRFASDRPDTGTYPFAAADFVCSGMRLYLGACIDHRSWSCFFEPTEGPFHIDGRDEDGTGRLNIRQISPFKLFRLNAAGVPSLVEFLQQLSVLRPVLLEEPHLKIASRYLLRSMEFEANLYQPRFEDLILLVTISLEAMLSPGREELKFRVAQRAANLVGETAAEREDVFALVSEAYDIRSRVAHGTFSEVGRATLERTRSKDSRTLTHKLRDVAREGLLRVATLLAKDKHQNRDQVMLELDRLGRRAMERVAGIPNRRLTVAHPDYDPDVWY